MLHTRSILLQASILLIAKIVSCQHYETEYGLAEGDAEEPVNAHHSHADVDTDAAQYYHPDSPAPDLSQIQAEVHPEGHAGFVPPLDFSSFYSPSYEYGASNKKEVLKPKNPFHEEENKKEGFVSKEDFSADLPQFAGGTYGAPDYFEESRIRQQQQQKEKEEKPEYEYDHPHQYNPHKTATEVDDLTEKLPRQKAHKKYNKYNPKQRYGKEQGPKKVPYQVPDYYYYHPKGKTANYNTGKSSSSVSQTPRAPGYYAKYAQSPSSLSPYQKYSFQPVQDNQGLKSSYYELSTVAPYNPAYSKIRSDSYSDYEPSESALKSSIKKGHCKLVNKEIDAKDLTSGRYKRQAMDCYVCEDPKTQSQFEKCSFSAPLYPKKAALSADPSELYNPVSDPYFRFKRYSKDEAGEGYADPYEYVKSQSQQQYYTKPEEYNKDHYKPQYSPEYEKSSSEIQAEKLQKSGADCKKVEKDGMTCTICSSKTGGNYEQCSYASKPSEQKYAYVRERKYDGNNPVSDKEVGSTEPKEVHHEGDSSANSKVSTDDYEKKRHPSSYEHEMEKSRKSKEHREDESAESKDEFEFPDYYKKENTKKKNNDKDSESYGTTDKEKKEKHADDYHIDEYHFKFFPEFSNEETKNDETYVKPGQHESKQDVEEVLAEFAKKDRSECKKARKNGMTCYLCVDKNGIQHEECMYVSESKPEVSKVSYVQGKEIKSPARTKSSHDNAGESSNIKLKEEIKRKVRMVDYEVAASEEHASRVKYNPEKAAKTKFKLYNEKKQKSKSAKDPTSAESREEDDEHHEKEYKELEEEKDDKDKKAEASEKSSSADAEEPQPKTPQEFVVGDEEGAFSAETKPVYSKTLGVTLPKYMLTKSEFEEIFDEFVAAG